MLFKILQCGSSLRKPFDQHVEAESQVHPKKCQILALMQNKTKNIEVWVRMAFTRLVCLKVPKYFKQSQTKDCL